MAEEQELHVKHFWPGDVLLVSHCRSEVSSLASHLRFTSSEELVLSPDKMQRRSTIDKVTREEWFFACLKGTLASYLRPSRNSRVTLQQLDGLMRRMQISCGVSEEKIKKAIASWIDVLPNCDPERAEEIRRKYRP